jgi:hypothetical protein
MANVYEISTLESLEWQKDMRHRASQKPFTFLIIKVLKEEEEGRKEGRRLSFKSESDSYLTLFPTAKSLIR